jgi:hypothetical protein
MTCTPDTGPLPPIAEPTTCVTYQALYAKLTIAGDAAKSQGIEPGTYKSFQAALHALRAHAEKCGCLDVGFKKAFPKAGRLVTVSVLESEDTTWIFS